MRKALLFGLRTKLVDVVSAREAGMIHQPDAEHLRWATREGRVLYSYNTGDYNELCNHLLARGALLARGEGHGGIVVASRQTYPVGEEIRRLLRLMQRLSGEQMRGRIEFLSAWG